MDGLVPTSHQLMKQRLSPQKMSNSPPNLTTKQNHVGAVILYGVPIVSLVIEAQERLCLAQISNTLLKQFSYNEIHNRRVALGITCVQCTPVQLEILRRAGAMPVSSRRCGMITRREAERLCKSFLGDNAPPRLPDDFAFSVHHECAWGCRGAFLPARYNSSRAKCIKCSFCGLFFSPNKFIFHSHRTSPNATYVQPDAANFNSWRRHMKLSGSPPENIVYAWEDVKAMFNGGTRKRMLSSSGYSRTTCEYNQRQKSASSMQQQSHSEIPSVAKPAPLSSSPIPNKQIKMDSPPPTPVPFPPPTPNTTPLPVPHRVPPFPDLPIPITMMDYVWNGMDGLKPPFLSPYLPWFGSAKRSVLGFSNLPPIGTSQDAVLQHMSHLSHHGKLYHQSAFRPVYPAIGHPDFHNSCKKSPELDIPKKIPPHPRKCSMSPRPEELRAAGQRDATLSSDEASQNYTADSPKVVLKNEVNEESSDSSDSLATGESYKKSHETRQFSESLLKERPDLLRAIAHMKSEEREVYSRMFVRDLPEDGREGEYQGSSGVLADGGSDHDEDETVDIETTDDIPEEELKPVEERFQGNQEPLTDSREPLCTARSGSPEPPNQRIWTIARFSLDEPNRFPCKTSFSPDKYADEEEGGSREACVMNLTTGESSSGVSKNSKLDCLTCCPQPLSQL